MFGKIWQRYFLRETLKSFILIIVCFYGLYVLIDYASHSNGRNYHHSHFSLADFAQNYFFEFVQRVDVLIPFALLIATIRTLTRLNTQNELVALLAGGVKMKALLRPFLFLGFVFVGVMYLNFQFVLPASLKEMRHLYDVYALSKNKKNEKLFVQNLVLKDQSVLLFQKYDTSKNEFFDVYWVKSFDELYRIKYLSPNEKIPEGKYVDHFVRNNEGQIEKKESFEQKAFPEIRFNRNVLLDTVVPPEEYSLTKLWGKIPNLSGPLNGRESETAATFFQKMVLPWLSLLAVIAPAPFCVRFSRYFPTFFIYALGIFGLVACYLLLDASVVLASRQVLTPQWAIGAPFSLIFLLCFWKYFRLR